MTELSELELISQKWMMIDRIEPKDPHLEQSWFLTGLPDSGRIVGNLIDQCIGTSSQVEVLYDAILRREDSKKDVVGFYHTHTTFKAKPSALDDKTMISWVISLGKPLLSVIQGIDGVFAHIYFTHNKKVISEGPYPVTLLKSDNEKPQHLVLVDYRKAVKPRKVEQ